MKRLKLQEKDNTIQLKLRELEKELAIEYKAKEIELEKAKSKAATVDPEASTVVNVGKHIRFVRQKSQSTAKDSKQTFVEFAREKEWLFDRWCVS